MKKLIMAIWKWIRGLCGLATESLNDPVRDSSLAIEDAEAEVAKRQVEISEALASIKLLEGKSIDAKNEAQKWKVVAERAVAAGNDEDAKVAIGHRQNAERKGAALEQEIRSGREILATLRTKLSDDKAKIERAKANKEILEARFQTAQARKSLATGDGGMGGAIAELGRFEDEVKKSEANAEAAEELNENNDKNLSDKYFVAQQSVEDELAAMKKATE